MWPLFHVFTNYVIEIFLSISKLEQSAILDYILNTSKNLKTQHTSSLGISTCHWINQTF